MATKGQTAVVVERAKKHKTPAQLAKAERNKAEAEKRLAERQAHDKYVNWLRQKHGIVGGSDTYVFHRVGEIAIQRMEAAIAARLAKEKADTERRANYVRDTLNNPVYGWHFHKWLRGKHATYERAIAFMAHYCDQLAAIEKEAA